MKLFEFVAPCSMFSFIENFRREKSRFVRKKSTSGKPALIWMCHNRTYKNKINRLHERCLQLIYNDKRSSFEDLLEKDNSVSIHNKNLQALAIEMYKIHTKTSPEIMQEIFLVKEKGNYNLRNQSDFVVPQDKDVNYGLESIRIIGPEI